LHLPESLVRFAQVLAEDESLRIWFESLGEVSPRVRAAEFKHMAVRMQQNPAAAELAHATALLAAPGMYEALREAVEAVAGPPNVQSRSRGTQHPMGKRREGDGRKGGDTKEG
jgi:hypothetical protein